MANSKELIIFLLNKEFQKIMAVPSRCKDKRYLYREMPTEIFARSVDLHALIDPTVKKKKELLPNIYLLIYL